MYKIPNIKDREHFLSTLPELFDNLTLPEIAAIANTLGLGDIINDGGIIPQYSVDIQSSVDRYINISVNIPSIRLTATLYNYFNEVLEEDLLYTWTKNSGTGGISPVWVGKTINITAQDLAGIQEKDITFVVSVRAPNGEVYSDFITFTSVYSLSQVKIVPSVTTFVGATPLNITLRLEMKGLLPTTYRWYRGSTFIGSGNTYTLNNSEVEPSGTATIRVEVVDVKGNEHYDVISIPKVVNGNPGTPGAPGNDGSTGPVGPVGPQGSPGVPGIDGPMLRMLEWVEGSTYYNNSQVKDYVYYRPRNKWFKLNEGIVSRVATGDPTTQVEWVETTEVKGSVLAENANIGGWIMRNNMFFSQMGLYTDPTTGEMLYSNAVLNGMTGDLIFGNDEARLNKRGLIFKDDSGRERLVLLRDGGSGIPVIRMLNEDGSIYWEAGPQNFGIITQGTTQPSWSANIGVKRVTSLADNPDLVFNAEVQGNAAGFIRSVLSNQPNQNSAAILAETDAAFYTSGAFPNSFVYGYNSHSFGYVNKLRKGDIAANQDLIEGYYVSKSFVRPGDLPSSKLLPNGWYLMENPPTNINGGGLEQDLSSPSQIKYVAQVVYIKDGVYYREENVVVHTKTI